MGFDLDIHLSMENAGKILALDTSLDASTAMGGTEEHIKELTIPFLECKDGSDNLYF